MNKEKSPQEENERLDQAVSTLREEYEEEIGNQEPGTEEPRIGKELRMSRQLPRWVYTAIGTVTLVMAVAAVGLFWVQSRPAADVNSNNNGAMATAVPLEAPPTPSGPIPTPPPLITDPPLPDDAIPNLPEPTPLPTPPIEPDSS